jgi:hypothetical protein
MDKRFDIPWIGGSKYHGKGVPYTMDMRFDIPWLAGQNTMGLGFGIP